MHVAHLMEDAERLDPDLLQSVAVRHPSGLDVLASPSDMIPIDSVTVAFVDQLLRTATQTYDMVIVDLPNVWNDWTVHVLQLADMICMVTNITVPGIYQTRRQLEVLEANGLMPKLQVVANRVETRMFGRVDLKDSESVLGRRIDHRVANDYPTMRSANDEGRPIKEIRSSSRLVKDLKGLAQALSATLASEGVQP
jgi:pilus assembly protein CpaE